MKKIKYIFLLAGVLTFFTSCDDEEKYSGTPVGNQAIEVVKGSVLLEDESLTSVLTNQKIPFRVELERTFSDTVTVEVSTLNKSGGRTRVSVDVMPNQNLSEVEEINAAGGAIFDSTMEMYLSGIALKRAEPGKHYLITSDRITFNTGNTAVPSDDANKMQIRFSWFNPSTTRNNFRVFVDRPNAASVIIPNATNAGATISAPGGVAGLQVGMTVNVSSGKGAFPANTVITAINPGNNTFTVSQAPTGANALGNNAEVTAGGMDKIIVGANSVIVTPTPQLPLGISNEVIVPSTDGLYVGMVLYVTSGGNLRPATTISAVFPAENKIRLSAAPNNNNINNALVGATLVASYADALPLFSGGVIDHSITNNLGTVSNGTSTVEGDYLFKLLPISVAEAGADVRYRIVWKFPNGTSGFYEGVYSAATVNAPAKNVLKITKSGTGQEATYSVDTNF